LFKLLLRIDSKLRIENMSKSWLDFGLVFWTFDSEKIVARFVKIVAQFCAEG